MWDREFGFLREMLVAPVSRGSLVVGKCLGGATIATFQGFVFLALAGFAHVPYNAVLFLTLIGELLLLAFTLTAFGVMMAARIKQFQAFMALTQMLVLPLFFLSGALYPLNGLPSWLSVLTRIDPLTYVVGPMRHAVFSHLGLPPEVVAEAGARGHVGQLARPRRAIARDRRRHGPHDDGHCHRGVFEDRVKDKRAGPSGGASEHLACSPHGQAPGLRATRQDAFLVAHRNWPRLGLRRRRLLAPT